MERTFLDRAAYRTLTRRMARAEKRRPVPPPAREDPITIPADAALSVVLWGDAHVSDYLLARSQYTRAAALDVARAATEIDALVLAGDAVENGKRSEYRLMLDYYDLMRGRVRQFIPASGNHEVRLRPYARTVKRFAAYCRRANPALSPDRLYYACAVNGYSFIVLGTTRATFEEAWLDRTELAWFDAQLRRATADGKPVFVVLHQPLRYTHNLPAAWGAPSVSTGSVGAQSDALLEIMNRYRNVFLLSGHLHAGLGFYNFEDVGAVHAVNAPSVGVKGRGCEYNEIGTGYIMEVYADAVRFRARDFLRGKYLPALDREIPLLT